MTVRSVPPPWWEAMGRMVLALWAGIPGAALMFLVAARLARDAGMGWAVMALLGAFLLFSGWSSARGQFLPVSIALTASLVQWSVAGGPPGFPQLPALCLIWVLLRRLARPTLSPSKERSAFLAALQVISILVGGTVVAQLPHYGDNLGHALASVSPPITRIRPARALSSGWGHGCVLPPGE